MKTALFTTAYSAPIQYYARLLHAQQVCIETHCHYTKQSYRNRCVIASPNGPLSLTIPVAKSDKKILTKDIEISNHGNWKHLHWNALESAYNSTPFFEYYRDDFQPFYEKSYKYLFDFNERLRQMICELIGFNPTIHYSTEYLSTDAFNACDDLREIIHPKKPANIFDTDYQAIPYYQVFAQKNGFLPNLSIVDLLFNMGPESILVLRKSYN